MNLRPFIFRFALAALVLTTPSLWAQDGLQGALLRLGTRTDLLRDSFGQRLVAADFDQDQKPDAAILLGGDHFEGLQAFRIELYVTHGKSQKLSFTSSAAALSLSVLDVNRDGTPDLVVEQTFTRKRVKIWLNDGHGTFRLADIQDYPSGTQLPESWRANTPPRVLLPPYLASRSRSENLALISEPIRGPSPSDSRVLLAQLLLALSKPRTPNPSRGPPSPLSS
jgi:hypothetical protein